MVRLGRHLRNQFPIFQQAPHIYLDSAATSHKPTDVIEAISAFYGLHYGSIHRGLHSRSIDATGIYEQGRQSVQQFLGAARPDEIIFTSGTTSAINQVAFGYAGPQAGPGKNIVISALEHHANFLPWQQLCARHDMELRRIPFTDSGGIDIDRASKLIDSRTIIVGITQVSNVTGAVLDLDHIIELAHRLEVPVLVDAAQSVGHMEVQVQTLDCDFLAFSGHKVLGPTGIGVLYGKYVFLEQMEPYRFGGDMVLQVGQTKSIFKKPPLRFEGGSPHSAGVAGLTAAIDFLNQLGISHIEEHTTSLLERLIERLSTLNGVQILPAGTKRSALVSFTLQNVHPHDVASILGQQNIAIRAGHHCAQPLLRDLGISVTNRVSLHCYNDVDDIDALIEGIVHVKSYFD